MTGTAQITATRLPDGHGPPQAWKTVTCRRHSGPPLRFKGMPLAKHTVPLSDGVLAIELWRRKTPGFVVAVTGMDPPDASSQATLALAMDWLEGLCRTAPTAGAPPSLADLLERTPRQMAAHTALRSLAGMAMDDWDRLIDPRH